MEKTYIYIKRLLSFVVCLLVYYLLPVTIPEYISIPLLVITFSILHARVTNERPPHLFAFYRTESYFKQGGLRDLIRIFVTLFGFIYDAIIWAVWGVWLLFLLFIDLVDFTKTLVFWVLHAVIWFLRQYVPFIAFLYKISIHYLIRWPWWIYQIAYFNVRYAFNRNSYKIALSGTFLSCFIIFFFYFLEIVLEMPGVTFIGIILAFLPLTWTLGEISNLRARKLENEAYRTVRLKFQNGLEAVRSVLFYITLFVVLILTQLGLNLLGWIPVSGIPIAGFIFSLNTLISIILVFLCILIILGVLFIPSYRLFHSFSEIQLTDTVLLLKAIGRKSLQYIAVTIPGMIFSIIAMVLPFLLIALVTILSSSLKNYVIEIKINTLETEQAGMDDPVEAYRISKKIKNLEYIQQFPGHIHQEMNHRKNLNAELTFAKEDLKTIKEELIRNTERTVQRIDLLQNDIDRRMQYNAADYRIVTLGEEKNKLEDTLQDEKTLKDKEISLLNVDIEFLNQRIRQLSFVYFLGGLWFVVFGSLLFAFAVSYMGHVYHQLYKFRNDDQPSEWTQVIAEIRSLNPKQPLLGGTLFILSCLLIYLISRETGFGASFPAWLSSFLWY